MKFNTAIFYDVENLIKGYDFSSHSTSKISLEKILDDIRTLEAVEYIAVQRAYANWSDPRIGFLRQEINFLGIEPVQVFGLSLSPTKNAADLQMAVDIIEMIHLRPALEVYVIVSGDGGFVPVARKLHEYGKWVIGCAYARAANRVFQSVCNVFVPLPEPKEIVRPEEGTEGGLDPRNQRLLGHLMPLPAFTLEGALAKVREALQFYTDKCRQDLLAHGIHLPVVREGLRGLIPDFEPWRFGFGKFIEFLQCACAGLPLGVARDKGGGGTPLLVLRKTPPPGVELLPDLPARELHHPETYINLLSRSSPPFLIPGKESLRALVGWLITQATHWSPLEKMIHESGQSLQEKGILIAPETIKKFFLSLIYVGVFDLYPPGLSLSEQFLCLRKEYQNEDDLLSILHDFVSDKLKNLIGEVNDDLVRGFFF